MTLKSNFFCSDKQSKGRIHDLKGDKGKAEIRPGTLEWCPYSRIPSWMSPVPSPPLFTTHFCFSNPRNHQKGGGAGWGEGCCFSSNTKYSAGTSLVAQWLRIRLSMQGTQVWALVREDPTCHGATKPMLHNYWACARAREPQLLSPRATTTEARVPRAHARQQEKPPQWEAHTLQRRVDPEKARAQQWRPNAAINKQTNKQSIQQASAERQKFFSTLLQPPAGPED